MHQLGQKVAGAGGVPRNPHTFLTNVGVAGTPGYALLAQTQIAIFFATHGTTVIDPNGVGSLFEVPNAAPIPEGLNHLRGRSPLGRERRTSLRRSSLRQRRELARHSLTLSAAPVLPRRLNGTPNGGIIGTAMYTFRGLSLVLLVLLVLLGHTKPGLAADVPIDSMAQRMQACAACHGREGRAARDGYYPRIAGKPQEYLYRQLLNFRERRRGYAPMTHMVRHLSDDYLREIAAYFAALDLPYAAPPPLATTPEALALGENLVLRGDKTRGIPACTSCHGRMMTGVLPDVPGLLGLPRDYVNAQLGAWKSGLRRALPPDCMARVVQRLGAQDIAAVSMWLASQPVPADSRAATPAVSVAVAGRAGPATESAAPCGGLSGADGKP